MRRIAVIVIACLLFTTPCYAFSWSDKTLGIGNDKYFHLGMGFAVDSALRPNKHLSWLERKLIVAGVGVAKELSDVNRGGRFDFQDLGATIAGGLLNDVVKLTIKF